MTMADLSAMSQWSLNDGIVLMDERRVVSLIGAVATLTAGLTRIMQICALKMGLRFDGGGGF